MTTNNVGGLVDYYKDGKFEGRRELRQLPDKTLYIRDQNDNIVKVENSGSGKVTAVSSDGGGVIASLGRLAARLLGGGSAPTPTLTEEQRKAAEAALAASQIITSSTSTSAPIPIISQPIPAAQITGPDPTRAAVAARAAVGSGGEGGAVDTNKGKSGDIIAARLATDIARQTEDRPPRSELPAEPRPPTETIYSDQASRPQILGRERTRTASPHALTPEEIASYALPASYTPPASYAPTERRVRVTLPTDSPTLNPSESERPRIGTISLTRAQASRQPEASRQTASEASTREQQPRQTASEASTREQQPRQTASEASTREQQPRQESFIEPTRQTPFKLPETKPKSIIRQSEGDLTVQPQKKSIFVPDVSSFLDKARTLASDTNTVVKGIHPSNKKPNIANIIIIIFGIVALILVLIFTGSPPFHSRHASTKNVEKFYEIVKSNYLFPKNTEIPDDYGSHIVI